jgi:hypothetical protein
MLSCELRKRFANRYAPHCDDSSRRDSAHAYKSLHGAPLESDQPRPARQHRNGIPLEPSALKGSPAAPDRSACERGDSHFSARSPIPGSRTAGSNAGSSGWTKQTRVLIRAGGRCRGSGRCAATPAGVPLNRCLFRGSLTDPPDPLLRSLARCPWLRSPPLAAPWPGSAYS